MNSRTLRLENTACPRCKATADATSVIATGVDFEYHTSPDNFTMVRCNQCGLVRLNPRPSIDELPVIYPSDYIPYHFEQKLGVISNFGRNYFLQKRVSKIAEIAPDNVSILDVGCGNGGFLTTLKKFGNPTWQLAGNDIVDTPRDNLEAHGIAYHKGRIEELVGTIGTWDILLLKDVIEHLANPGETIQAVYHILRPGGYLFMETPDLRGWDAHLFGKRYWGGWHFPRHWTVYDGDSIRGHLTDLGYTDIIIRPTLSPNFWAQSIHHSWSEKPSLKHFADFFSASNPLVMAFFTVVDLAQTSLTGKSSNMQVIARKPK
jgi:SAM-dependent methyltransferase